MDNNNAKDSGRVLFSWHVPEYEKHDRSPNWYVYASIITIILLLFAIIWSSFLFAILIIVTAFVVILHDAQEPDIVKFAITDEGVVIGRKFIDYDEIDNFSVIYKPKIDVKRIYFEYKNKLKMRLSVSLENKNPLTIRQELLKYLPENLDRVDEPISEGLAKMFKL